MQTVPGPPPAKRAAAMQPRSLWTPSLPFLRPPPALPWWRAHMLSEPRDETPLGKVPHHEVTRCGGPALSISDGGAYTQTVTWERIW